MQPRHSAVHVLQKFFGLRTSLQFGFAFALSHPQLRNLAIAVDGHRGRLLLEQGKRVNYGEKLAYVVCAERRSVVEHLLTCAQIHSAVFHLSGIATASRIDSQCFGFHFGRQRQNGVGSP